MNEVGKSGRAGDPFEAMDQMYRFQRYFYDLTRKFYLLGRDRLLQLIPVSDGDLILEAGCGTARNLIVLAERYPNVDFYGLDASAAMLETARPNIRSAAVSNISLKSALANDFSYRDTFALDRKFDTIFFSYSISMIPPWRESIENALANLESGGRLYIVDFYDQKDLPGWFERLLKWWLSKFHVQFWDELMPFLRSDEMKDRCDVRITSLYRRYSFIAELKLK